GVGAAVGFVAFLGLAAGEVVAFDGQLARAGPLGVGAGVERVAAAGEQAAAHRDPVAAVAGFFAAVGVAEDHRRLADRVQQRVVDRDEAAVVEVDVLDMVVGDRDPGEAVGVLDDAAAVDVRVAAVHVDADQ